MKIFLVVMIMGGALLGLLLFERFVAPAWLDYEFSNTSGYINLQ